MNNLRDANKIINKAFEFHLKGNIVEAAKYYQSFIDKGFKDYKVFSNYGLVLRDLGKLKDAEISTRKAIELNPDFTNAYSNYGLILRDLGKLKDAEISTRKAIELNPNYAIAHSNLGIILRDLGKLKDAEISIRKAIELNPNYADAHCNLGNVLRDLDKLKNAELSYRKAIELNPNYTIAHSNLGIILRDHGRLKDAEISTQKAIELDPYYEIAHLNLGLIFRDLGKLKDAETSTRKAIELNPDYAEAYLNLGLVLRDHGRLKDAEISTRKAIELNPNAEAYSNLGNILRDLGKLQDAEVSILKAIELNHKYSVAHLNLGLILRDLGKLQDAEISTRKAIELNPDYANAHCNLGNVLRDLGKLQDAEVSYRKAIELNPQYAVAHANLGHIFRDLGKLKDAFDSYLKVIHIDPSSSYIYHSITEFLQDSDISLLNKLKLKNILRLLLEKNNVSHKKLFKVFNFLYSNQIIENLRKIDSDFSSIELLINDQVIINALKKIIFCDPKLERLLTKVRRNICHRVAKNIETINCSELQFIIALGEQCFLNEYVYTCTSEETISVNKIINKCIKNEVNETNISILSCYFPLYKLLEQIPSLKSFKSLNQSFKELIKLQISEPLEELELSKNIKKIGSINNDISQKIKSQYEENPYPRWRYSITFNEQKISTLQSINYEIEPNHLSKDLGDRKLKVLVAGCGTGQQILHTQIYKNAQVTCIDISLSSLAYAQRKIDELEISNVELIQMDILEVYLLEEHFDIILCSGVLHHMDDPLKGLNSLLSILKKDGFLKLGLYSETARRNIIQARNYINGKQLHPNNENIRNFRETVFSKKLTSLNSLVQSPDFYTISSCRDLCFHEKEHRFTIQQLKETLKSNDLKFLGFLLRKQVKSLYKKSFPEDKKQTNLENWAKFEENRPITFSGMYQFWVCKM